MSLRDQLLAKGLATKKDARRVNRELKKKRKDRQGKRRKKSAVEREAREAQTQRVEELARTRAVARKEREELAEAELQRRRLVDIARGNAVRARGKVQFHHRSLDGGRLVRTSLSERVAWKLRAGEAAIVGVPARGGPGVDYLVVSIDAARRIQAIDPKHVVFLTEDTTGISEAHEAFHQPRWEMSLGPRRVSEDEARAWLAQRGKP